MFKIAIAGRPNVGKSTLFNRLSRRRLAITHDLPGVTRDIKETEIQISGISFSLLDTAGFDYSKQEIAQKMTSKSSFAIEIADIVFFMVDARAGLFPEDKLILNMIRKKGKKMFLLVNKAELQSAKLNSEFYSLGIKEIFFISSEHNLGFKELEEGLIKVYNESISEKEAIPAIDAPEEVKENIIKIAILGKPNAGKSTLFNRLLREDKSIVSDIAGTTRDAISYQYKFKEQKFELIDTAGMRRKSKIHETLEQLSIVESLNALRRSNMVVLVVDATEPLKKQDLSILNVAVKEGKPIVLLLNKCDLINNKSLYKEEVNEYIDEKLFELKGLPVLFISALNDKNLNPIWESAIHLNEINSKNIPTNKLNAWLESAIENHSPPLSTTGRRIKLKYINQTAIKPLTFCIYGNAVKDVPESYARYLYNNLRDAFKLHGVPIRLRFKKNDNPYA